MSLEKALQENTVAILALTELLKASANVPVGTPSEPAAEAPQPRAAAPKTKAKPAPAAAPEPDAADGTGEEGEDPAPTPAPAPAPRKAAPKAKAVTLPELQQVAVRLQVKKTAHPEITDRVREILAPFGVTRLSDPKFTADNYPSVHEALLSLAAEFSA